MADNESRSRGAAVFSVMGAVVLLGLAAWLYKEQAPQLGAIVDFELSGSSDAAAALVGENGSRFRSALLWDFFLIPGYAAAIFIVCWMSAPVFLTTASRMTAKAGALAGILAGVADVAENLFLLAGVSDTGTVSSDWQFQSSAAFATVKFGLLVFAAPVALTALIVVLKRGIGSALRDPCRFQKMASKIQLPWVSINPDGTVWPQRHESSLPHTSDASDSHPAQLHAHYESSYVVPDGRNEAEVGFCLSGGGIRAAAVALGALQSLRPQLRKARYLVSVSGGGYTAGAMQLALQDNPPPGKAEPVTVAEPEDVYNCGTVEEDHTRRHGNYIAEGAREWAAALITVLRGLIASLAIIAAAVITVGLVLSYLYDSIPFVNLDGFASYLAHGGCKGITKCPSPTFPQPLGYGDWTLLWVAIAGVVFWFASTTFIDERGLATAYRFCRSASRVFMSLAAVLIGLLYVLPATAWAAAYLAWAAPNRGFAPEAAGGAAGIFAFTYVAALVSIAWRRKKEIGGLIDKIKGLFGKDKEEAATPHAVANGFMQYAIVWVALGVLLVVELLLLGITIIDGHQWNPWVQGGIPLGLAIIFAFVDQTWMSLHPFYRRRLATAFSVRRVEVGGKVAARAYDFDNEGTPLDTYGARQKGFPQVIFAGAANLSGQARTPPGRRAVSFTMSHDAIGGPDLGYVPTGDLTNALSGPLRADLTVQAAVATSGAAFASAMGRQAKTFQTLLAISNARLGTWLPNPAYIDSLSQATPDWRTPGLPRIRRLPYFLREIFGRFSHQHRLVLVTDGGHYDNLGLVELLRHKCRTIYCIDASGDSPPFPQTLYEAITLADEELGIEIKLENAFGLHPGSATVADDDPLFGMKSRLSEFVAVKSRIKYPFEFQADGEKKPSDTGTLIFAKALLKKDMPGQLLAYANATPIFPRDGTGDQWFTQDQFDNYHALGRYIGSEAAELRGT